MVMNKTLILFALIILSVKLNGQNAKIKIDTDRKIGVISDLIYGNFVEHLGRCVYGGIYEPGSPLADQNGIRKDVLEAARELKIPIIRYPGGNFVSNYHWLDGVGPREERIPRMELAWHRLEPNTFGTNEFVDFARKLGTEPYFAVNMGTGTIEEAQRWVEYCNVKEGSFYAELRKKHGYAEPHNVKYWSLGNEMDGYWQMGHLNAEDYTKKAREAAKLMRLTDPTIKLVAAGSSNYRSGAEPDEWNRTILLGLKDVIDFIALHIYVGNPQDNYYNFMATPLVLEERTRIVKGMIMEAMQKANRGTRDPIYISWDEYNVWYRARGGAFARGENALEEKYNLEDALVVAGILNAIVRNADVVRMANMAQLVNVIAPIFSNEKGLFRQTIYFPLQLFSTYVHGNSLDVFVDCEKYDTDEFFIGLGESKTRQTGVPYLDVSAAYQNDEVTICVVNRHKDKSITTDIILQTGEFNSPITVYEVNGTDIKSMNDFGKENVTIETKPEVKAKGQKATYSFPAHSFTLLKGKIKT
jgi:alpha-L-arabinofuranosidase